MRIKQLLVDPVYFSDTERGALARIFYVIAIAVVAALCIATVNNLLFGQAGVPIVDVVARVRHQMGNAEGLAAAELFCERRLRPST